MRIPAVFMAAVSAILLLPAVALADSDMAITSFTESADPLPEQSLEQYNVVVKNNGPNTATNVELVVTAPAALLASDSASPSQGTASFAGNKVTVSFGTIANGATASAGVNWTGEHPGSGTTTASVSFTGTETNAGNDDRSDPITVTGLTAAPIDFGDQVVGTVGPVGSTVITNGSALAVTLAASTPFTGNPTDFLIFTDCFGVPIPPGGTCTQTARFLPAALGARDWPLTLSPVTSFVDPAVLDLKGRGVAAPTLAGPAGAQGPAGPAGPAGPTGPAAFKLVVVPVSTKLRSRAGRGVTLAYASTLDAKVTLDVLKGSKRVARVPGTAVTGANKLRWNGKAGRKAASAGAYRLRLTAVSGDQKAVASAKLTLTRR